MSKRKFLNQTGETIVEVLFAIAVLASALGGAFAISTRSRNTIQANQERYQAQLIASGQADSIRLYDTYHTDLYADTDATNNNKFFCMDKTNPANTLHAYGTLPELQTSSHHQCARDNATNQNLYTISIQQVDPTNHIFLITVFWDSLVTNGQDRVELVYGI
jgi:type II secretory pathway pseudopilin PulG